MPSLVAEQRVEEYRVVKLAASGGFGAVYEVVREDIGLRGAMKVLTLNPSPELVKRFLNEARAISLLRHPNIPQIYDVGRFPDGAPWLVMEFLQGESLEARLLRALKSRQKGLPFADVMEIGEDITAALNAAHEKDVIHRDVKPSNVMLVADAKAACGVRALVLDFGIARMTGDDLTQTGAILGTPAYMAPEQAADARKADALSDVYSVGMVLYTCLAGRPPFDIDPARGPYGVLLAKAEPPEPLSRHAPHVPPEIQVLIMRTLERDPKQRPAMGDLEEALGRYRPPRRTGKTSSAHVVAVNPPLPLGRPGQGDEDSEPTDSVTDDAVALPSLSGSLLQAGTPSDQQARGEISPPGRDGPALLVPRSISDVPSMPMALPPLTASPHDPTAKPAPTQGVPAATASPSAPTKSAGPAAAEPGPSEPQATAPTSRGMVLALAGVAVALSIALTAAVWRWPGGPRKNGLPSPQALAAQPTAPRTDLAMGIAAVTPVPNTDQSPKPGPAVGPPLVAAPKPPGLDKPAIPDKATAGEKPTASDKPTATEKPASRCRAVTFTAACIHAQGQAQTAEVRGAVLEALRERPLRLCSGDRVVIGMGANGLRVLEAPPRLSDAAQQDFLLTLRGSLDVTPRSGRIEIQCPDRDR